MIDIPGMAIPKRPSIVDQVSSSLQDPSAFSEPEVIKPTSDSDSNKDSCNESSIRIADEVSLSLTNPTGWNSDGESIEIKQQEQTSPSKTVGSISISNSRQQQQQQDLPSLEECLYGAVTGRSPFIPNGDGEEKSGTDGDDGDDDGNNSDDHDDDDDQEQTNSKKSALDMSIDDGDELNSRWSSSNLDIRADYHDIDIAVLRKLCSHGSGIPEDEGPHHGEDDGNGNVNADNDATKTDNGKTRTRRRGTCHRGVAWRVLLEQLPVRDVHANWPKTLPPKRKLYRELVEKYLEDAIDPGKNLKGESHWEQSLRLQNNTNKNNGTVGSGGDENDAGDKTSPQHLQQQQHEEDSNHQLDWKSSSYIRATEDIYDDFPPNSKYRELWKRAGITLNQGESAAAIQMNRLKIPKELLLSLESEHSEDDNNSDPSDSEQNDDAIEGNEKIEENTESNEDTSGQNDDTIEANDEVEQQSEDNMDNSGQIEGEQNDDNSSVSSKKADERAHEDSAKSESDSANERRRDDVFEQFCKDAKLLSEIRKDVVRTNPHLRFYLETRNRLGIRRHAALERILFVWAKLNGNLYVQGMNEIVGTIYYVLAMDPTTSSRNKKERHYSWADHAEADTYYLFNALLNKMEVRDVFVADLDHHSESGLHARIKNIEMLLKEHDPEVYNHLKGALGMDSSFYAIRWLTTLLSREFQLPDTIRLWDSLLASKHKENFLRYVCASMVMAVRDRLLRGDFGTCLKLLQNYPSGEIAIDDLLESSRALWIYETQISLACQKGGIPLRQALKVITPPEGVIMAFGRPGGKPLGLASQISSPVVGVMRDVASTAVAANNNVGKLMGRAKKLWGGWNTPTKKENETENVNESETKTDINNHRDKDKDTDEDGDKDNATEDEDEWDLIDSIIDGKTEYVSTSFSLNSSSSIIESTVVVADLVKESADSTNFVTPTKSPRRAWKSSSPLVSTNSIDDANDVVEDYSNNDDSLNQNIRTGASSNGGFWNRMRRSY